MRLLWRADPRWVALLLVPVLLAAGAARPDPGPPVTVTAADPPPPAVLPLLDGVSAVADAAPLALERTAAAVHGVAPARHRIARGSRSTARDVRPPSVEERGRAALAGLGYDPAALGYRVRFLPYRGRALGTIQRRSRLITVYVSGSHSDQSLRVTLAHELGHALDFTHGTAARRESYRRIRGLRPGAAWFPCNRCADYATPAGDFAEVFALWLAGPGDFRSRLKGPPTAEQLRRLAPLFRLPQPQPPTATPTATATATPAAAQPQSTPPPRSGLTTLLGPAPTPSPGRR